MSLVLACPPAAARHLPGPMEFVIHGHNIPDSAYSILVQEAGKQEPLLAVNPGSVRNPASVIKIVTTLAALEILGPAWTWETAVYLRGRQRGDTVDGDILIKGHGDPYLTTAEMWKLLKEVKRRGISRINGDLIIDNSYFDVPREDPGKFDNKPLRTYNVQPDAMLVNFKAAYFHFRPAANGRDVVIQVDPELANLRIENRLRQRKSGCYGYQRGVAVSVPNPPLADHIIFEGRFPSGCSYYAMSRTVLEHHTFAWGVFKSLWQQLGGSISGNVRYGKAQADEDPFLVWDSIPLSDVIKKVNKYSNNVMTRQLLLTIAAEEKEAPGTIEKGQQVILEYLQKNNMDTASINLPNGSGLSRDTAISARLLADILAHAHNSLFQPEFESSLSILGMDGTARNRLKSRRESGRAHVKTGTIDHVSAIGGYVIARNGKKYIVVAMINHRNVHKGPGEEFMNALVRWVYTQ